MNPESTLEKLHGMAAASDVRKRRAKQIADVICASAGYHWVGIYDVDVRSGQVSNIAWSGPDAPAYPVFALTQGLTAVAVAEKRTVNVGDVTQDPHYLTAFGGTRSEIIVPVLDEGSGSVMATIDVESESLNAFDPATQAFLEEILSPGNEVPVPPRSRPCSRTPRSSTVARALSSMRCSVRIRSNAAASNSRSPGPISAWNSSPAP